MVILHSIFHRNFTSPWSHLSDATNIPCHGEIRFEAEGIKIITRHKKFRFNLLFPVPGFGEVMLSTSLIKNNHQLEILEEKLIAGRLEQIKKIASSKTFKQAEKIAKGKPDLNNLKRLMFLGESIAVKNATKLLIEKESSKFKPQFGCQVFNLHRQNKFHNFFRHNFDFGVVPTYFFMTRPDKKRFSFKNTDQPLKTLRKLKRDAKGSPLVWLHAYAIPDWLKKQSFSQLINTIEHHVEAVVKHSQNRITIWDIINEFPASDANGMNLNISQLLQIAKITSNAVNKIDPKITRIINFSEVFGAGSSIKTVPSVPIEHFLNLCQRKRIGFEGIGLQMYFGLQKEFSCRELLDISLLLDSLDKFNRPLHLTEIGFPSEFKTDPNSFFKFNHPASGGWWHEPWNEKMQAEFLDKLLTIFFSKKNSASVCWWDLTDQGSNRDVSSKFFPWSGLLRSDGSLKPVAKVWQKWKQTL